MSRGNPCIGGHNTEHTKSTMEVPKTYKDSLVVYVNGKKICDSDVDPDMTLLSYLRTKLRLTGSKYSCGEGGCGACTVMLSNYDDQQKKILHYAINACYTPICALHGMAVTTVEGIGSTRTKLHPVQERIGKAHGLQCGFCTPGMVMSMYTLLRNNPQPNTADIEESLVGNLCRCTGYRPIIEGFKTFTESGCCGNPSACLQPGDEYNDMVSGLFTPSDFAPYDPTQEIIFPSELQLNDKYRSGVVQFSSSTTTWIRPTTLKDLLRLKFEIPDAVIVVGNAEVGFDPTVRKLQPKILLSASRVAELLQIDVSDDAITFGSSVSMARMCEVLKKRVEDLPSCNGQTYAELLNMLHQVGDCQLRNVSGIGSHILSASPLSDLTPLLMASRTTLIVASLKGGSRPLSLNSSFFVNYRKTCLTKEEVLVSITIPAGLKNEYFAGYKVKKQVHRRDKEVSMVNAGFRALLEGKTNILKEASLIFGGIGPTVVIANSVSEKMCGRKWDEALLKDVQHMLGTELQLSPQGGMVEYRRSLLRSFFFKFYLKVLNEHCERMSDSSLSDSDRPVLLDVEKLPSKSTQLYQEVPTGQPQSDPVGRPIILESACQLATGEAVYCDDVPPEPGELHMALVFSTRPHAKIISVDKSAALSLEGVRCYVDATDVPGKNTWPAENPLDEDSETFASDKVIHVGQPIGGILAETQDLARKAAKLVKVLYEDMDYVLSIEDAIKRNSFFQHVRHLEGGDVAAELEICDHVLEEEVYVGAQSHYYMETQSCIARPQERDEILIIAASQNLHDLQMSVAETLNLPANKITAKIRRLGGGFGGKLEPAKHMARMCAVAAKKCAKPVRLSLGRDEDMQFVGTRHAVLAKYKVGWSVDGKLKALQLELLLNGGCTEGPSSWIADKMVAHSCNTYKVPVYDIKARICKTNISSCGSMRGVGTPKSVAVMEMIMDAMARKSGIKPEKIREINLYKEGDVDNVNQELLDIQNLRRCWDECLQRSDYYQRRLYIDNFNNKSRWKKKGLAVVPLKRCIGFEVPFLNQAAALVHIYLDGSVLISHGGIEMGQGLYTKTVQIASRVFRIPAERIHINETSSDKVPNSTPTAASSGTDLYGNAVRIACEILMERMEPIIYENPKGSWEDWVGTAFMRRISLSASGFFKYPDIIGFDWNNLKGSKGQYYFSYGAACCEVEVDCLTGDHQLKRTDIVMDVGDSLNPALDIGQIEGGFMQGYGLYTLEELRYSKEGKLLTKGPGMYRIPQIGDIPSQFNVTLLKGAPNKVGLYSSKGVGEPPLHLAFAAHLAIKDAVSSARADAGLDGQFRLDSPATPERIRLACPDEFSNKLNNRTVLDCEFFIRP
ncbi:xanthine dehydrogenase/oxidase-like [Ptychodera flava]|uniref:xanthine dehydrogenase/oxidase-like n=1 Tax=Ptychodera flava TaxID=63121 RepID=UPI003969F03C